MRKLLICLVSLCALAMSAQVTTTPSVIEKGYTGQVTITYDPTKGNGALASATAIYAHTGLITSASSSDGDWKNVVLRGLAPLMAASFPVSPMALRA